MDEYTMFLKYFTEQAKKEYTHDSGGKFVEGDY